MKKLFFICIAAAMFSGCASTYYKYSESSARNLEPEHTMLTTPIIADLDVSPIKIHHVERRAFEDVIVDQSIPNYISEFKKIALASAAEAYDADILVGTTIKVETIRDRLVITVTGYPAHYKNIRNATIEDAELVQKSQIFINTNNAEVVKSPRQTLNSFINK